MLPSLPKLFPLQPNDCEKDGKCAEGLYIFCVWFVLMAGKWVEKADGAIDCCVVDGLF